MMVIKNMIDVMYALIAVILVALTKPEVVTVEGIVNISFETIEIVAFFLCLATINIYFNSYQLGVTESINYKASLRSYFDFFSIQLLTLFSVLLIRFSSDNYWLDLFLSTIIVIVIGYSRNYLYIAEFFRLTSAIFSIGMQMMFQTSYLASVISIIFFVLYGRIGMEIVSNFFLNKRVLKKKASIGFFCVFLLIHIRLKKLTNGKIKSFVFYFILFSLLPNIYLYFFDTYKYILLFSWGMFLLVMLIANTCHNKIAIDPKFAVFFCEQLMELYPIGYDNILTEIFSCASTENYYILDHPDYLELFQGKSWIVVKYIERKRDIVKQWGVLFITDYATNFLITDTNSALENEINRLIYNALNYIKDTGNNTVNKASVGYIQGMALLRENKSNMGYRHDLCEHYDTALSKHLYKLDYCWEECVLRFYEKNKEKGMQFSFGFLNSVGS